MSLPLPFSEFFKDLIPFNIQLVPMETNPENIENL